MLVTPQRLEGKGMFDFPRCPSWWASAIRTDRGNLDGEILEEEGNCHERGRAADDRAALRR